MTLLPRESGKLIASLAEHVKISSKACEDACDMVAKAFADGKISIHTFKNCPLNPNDVNLTYAVDWIFLVDTLNFSFWSDSENHYEVKYHDEVYTGYWALCAAVNRAIEEGYNITTPAWYATVSMETVQHILRSTSGVPIPLLKDRHTILNKTGKILLEKFGGTFLQCLEQCHNNAQNLLRLIVDHFPSYRDEAEIENQKVSFYKRAQILIGDIWCCFEGKGYGAFDDIDSLTMFADYRIPQVLVYFEVLEYSDELKEKLQKGELIENGDRLEVEIRGCTVWAVELMNENIKERQKNGLINKDIKINPILIDQFLWEYRRENAKLLEHIPFHRTRCIYY